MALWKPLTAVLLLVVASLGAIKAATGFQAGHTPDLAALSDADLKTATVHFERSACYGTCPAYVLTIYGDGRVEYSGKNHVKVKAAREGRIEQASVKTLLKEFERANFLSISNQYGNSNCGCKNRCTDMATAITDLTVGGVTHHIEHYYGCICAPKALFNLESAIDKAAHIEQWTGDVSKQGPFGTTCF